MVLERKLSSAKGALDTLGNRINGLQRQLEHFDLQSETLMSAMAAIYVDVISPLGPRIQVTGSPAVLQSPQVQAAQHRCAGKLHQRIQRQQNAIVGGDVVRVNQIAQEARQHRHNQADADSVERDSAQNYDQGSVGFHVWPPDQPPLVRLNARILYH